MYPVVAARGLLWQLLNADDMGIPAKSKHKFSTRVLECEALDRKDLKVHAQERWLRRCRISTMSLVEKCMIQDRGTLHDDACWAQITIIRPVLEIGSTIWTRLWLGHKPTEKDT